MTYLPILKLVGPPCNRRMGRSSASCCPQNHNHGLSSIFRPLFIFPFYLFRPSPIPKSSLYPHPRLIFRRRASTYREPDLIGTRMVRRKHLRYAARDTTERNSPRPAFVRPTYGIRRVCQWGLRGTHYSFYNTARYSVSQLIVFLPLCHRSASLETLSLHALLTLSST